MRPIIFTSDRDSPSWDIYLLKEAGQFINLTMDGFINEQPVWSPDGRTIAFVSDRTGPIEVFTMDQDGTGVRQITNDGLGKSGLTWSSDGRWLVYSRWNAVTASEDLYRKPLEGGPEESLVTTTLGDWGPDVSTDGKMVWVQENRIEVANEDGSNPHQVFASAWPVGSPRWSPDGSMIVFTAFEPVSPVIWAVTEDGKSQWRVTAEGWWCEGPAWSPDGTRIVFSRGMAPADLWVVDPDGSDPQPVLTGPWHDRQPAW
jgi:TolB protein